MSQCHETLTVFAVAIFHDLFLSFGGSLHAQYRQPCAFVVLDVGADLAGHLWITETIQKVVLHLEKVSHFQKNGFGLTEYLGVIISAKWKCTAKVNKSHWEIVEELQLIDVSQILHVLQINVPSQMHCQRNGQIECVICRFVIDN